MRVLFIGGTGIISLACTREALRGGHDVFHLNRGNHPELAPREVTTLKADIRDEEQIRKVLKGQVFDCVVNWVAFLPRHVKQDIRIFEPLTDQYVFISSASVYEKPPTTPMITEATPLANPFWQYARNKIECESILIGAYVDQGFPCTIVRPSHTYTDGWIPTPLGSRDYTMADRLLLGREVVSPGDGRSLWTLTHSEDFARGFTGLLGREKALGEAYHITSNETLTWDEIYGILAAELDVEPKIVHIPPDFIYGASPLIGPGMLGDKAYRAVFDNSKIREIVPDFEAKVPFKEGIRRSLQWFREKPERMIVDGERDAEIDRILKLWKKSGSQA